MNEWNGYSYDELQYKRAETLVNYEIAKMRFQMNLTNILDKKVSNFINVDNLINNIIKTVDTINLFIFAYRLGKRAYLMFKYIYKK